MDSRKEMSENMKKNKIKKTLVGALAGVVIGIIFGHIASKLCIMDNLLLITALLMSVVMIALILTEDLEIRLNNAYKEGRRFRTIYPYHPNCRHTYKPHEDE